MNQSTKIRIPVVLTISLMIAMGLATVALTPVHAASCETVNHDVCSPIGVGFNNFSLFPYLLPAGTSADCPTASSTGGCAPLELNTTLAITTSITFPGNTPSAAPFSEEGCGTYDTANQDAAAFTYQNNFFDPNGEVIQEVLTVGFPSGSTIDPNSGACFTIETNPAGSTQTYDDAAVDISQTSPVTQSNGGNGGTCYICPVSDSTLQKFYTAGNSIGFDIVSHYSPIATSPNGVTRITTYILTLNGQEAASISTSAISGTGGSDTTYHGCNGAEPYACSNDYQTGTVNGTEQSFEILGNGDGDTATFATGYGSLSYCGTFPATGLGGVVGYGGGTLEDSDTGYGNLTATTQHCSLGLSGSVWYTQPFCMGASDSISCVAPISPIPTPEFPWGTLLSILAPMAAVGLYVLASGKVRAKSLGFKRLT